MGKLLEGADWVGNMRENQTFYFWFTTCDKDGNSVAMTSLGSTGARQKSSTSPSAGLTVDQNADGRTGCHRVTVDTSAAFYNTGEDFVIQTTGAVVDGETIDAALCAFSIENRLE